ncbi:hypothetical protein KM043_016695 [Ampulex compressa]|nr:hypothetical protein KM043_016695 [Ampulex compressa]
MVSRKIHTVNDNSVTHREVNTSFSTLLMRSTKLSILHATKLLVQTSYKPGRIPSRTTTLEVSYHRRVLHAHREASSTGSRIEPDAEPTRTEEEGRDRRPNGSTSPYRSRREPHASRSRQPDIALDNDRESGGNGGTDRYADDFFGSGSRSSAKFTMWTEFHPITIVDDRGPEDHLGMPGFVSSASGTRSFPEGPAAEDSVGKMRSRGSFSE